MHTFYWSVRSLLGPLGLELWGLLGLGISKTTYFQIHSVGSQKRALRRVSTVAPDSGAMECKRPVFGVWVGFSSVLAFASCGY